MKKLSNNSSKQNIYLIISAISSILFIFIIFNLLSGGFLTNVDINFNESIKNAFFSNNPILNAIALTLDYLFEVIPIIIASFIIFLYFQYKRRFKDSLFFIIIMLANAFLIWALKIIIQRPRPGSSIFNYLSSGYAFPSGHTTNVVVFLGLLIYFSWKYLKKENKNIKIFITIILSLIAIIVGFSRLYLGIHWLTDVLGGLLLGLFILSSGIFTIEKFK